MHQSPGPTAPPPPAGLRPRRRAAFTLVELLVAMALIVFLMAILSSAFVTATRTFSGLKGVGDLNAKLRMVRNLLTADLNADHFEDQKKLSDPDFWKSGPPQKGFFRVYHGTASTSEGSDLDGLSSYRSATHALQFTNLRQGNTRAGFHFAKVPAGSPLLNPFKQLPGSVPVQNDARFQDSNDPSWGTYAFPWAELAYYLRATSDVTEGGTPLFKLCRRQRVLTPDDDNVIGGKVTAGTAGYDEVSFRPTAGGSYNFNGPIDTTVPNRRLQISTTGGNVSVSPDVDVANSDVILNDVVSFDVRLMFASGAAVLSNDFIDLFHASLSPYVSRAANPSYGGAGQPRVFDTWSSVVDKSDDYSRWSVPGTAKSIPLWRPSAGGMPVTVRGVQIIIRAWDFKTQQTRQVTVVQDL